MATRDSIIYVVAGDRDKRDSLKEWLVASGCDVTCFGSAREFLNAAPSLPPGCLITVGDDPKQEGLSAIKEAKKNDLDLRAIVIVSESATVAQEKTLHGLRTIEVALDRNAIIDAVRQARTHMPLERRETDPAREAKDRLARLSGREREIFERVVAGMTNKAIAAELNIGVRTVEFYRSRVMTKMRAGNLVELIRIALAVGIEL